MKLSNHFSLEEFTVSQEATRKGLNNTPSPAMVEKLRSLAWRMEEVRTQLGCFPVSVSSAYRSPEVNSAVGGSKTSSHCLGEAVDFTCHQYGSNAEVVERLRGCGIKFDQLILEYPKHANGGWVHIGFGLKSRQEVITTDDGKEYRRI